MAPVSSQDSLPECIRGWTQVPLAQAAWVQIPQLSCPRICFLPRHAASSRIPHAHAALQTLRRRSHETHGYCPCSCISRRRNAVHSHGMTDTVARCQGSEVLPNFTGRRTRAALLRMTLTAAQCCAFSQNGGAVLPSLTERRNPAPRAKTMLPSFTTVCLRAPLIFGRLSRKGDIGTGRTRASVTWVG